MWCAVCDGEDNYRSNVICWDGINVPAIAQYSASPSPQFSGAWALHYLLYSYFLSLCGCHLLLH